MKSNDCNEAKVSLVLTSKINLPEEVTALTALQPTKSWRINEPIEGTKRLYDWNGWSFSAGLDPGMDLEAHVLSLIKAVKPILPVFKELSVQWDIDLPVANRVPVNCP